MLQALISYFPEKEKVAGVGALEYSKEERKKMAVLSKSWKCNLCGPIFDHNPTKVDEAAEKAKEKEKQEKIEKELAEAEAAAIKDTVEIKNETNKDDVEHENAEQEKNMDDEDQNSTHKQEKFETSEVKRNEVNAEKRTRQNYNMPEFMKPKSSKNIKTNVSWKSRDTVYKFALERLLLEHKRYFDARESVIFTKNTLAEEEVKDNKEIKKPSVGEDKATATNVPSSHNFSQPRDDLPEKEVIELQNIKKKIELIQVLQIIVVIILVIYVCIH